MVKARARNAFAEFWRTLRHSPGRLAAAVAGFAAALAAFIGNLATISAFVATTWASLFGAQTYIDIAVRQHDAEVDGLSVWLVAADDTASSPQIVPSGASSRFAVRPHATYVVAYSNSQVGAHQIETKVPAGDAGSISTWTLEQKGGQFWIYYDDRTRLLVSARDTVRPSFGAALAAIAPVKPLGDIATDAKLMQTANALFGLVEAGTPDCSDAVFVLYYEKPDAGLRIADIQMGCLGLDVLNTVMQIERASPGAVRAILGSDDDLIASASGSHLALTDVLAPIFRQGKDVREAWRQRFIRIAKLPQFHQVSDRFLDSEFRRARAWLAPLGLHSARAQIMLASLINGQGNHNLTRLADAYRAQLAQWQSRQPSSRPDRLDLLKQAIVQIYASPRGFNRPRDALIAVMASGAGDVAGFHVDTAKLGLDGEP